MEDVILPTLPTYMFEPNLRGLASMFLTILLPLLVALLTRPSTSGVVKGLGLLALSAIKTVVEAFMVGGNDFDLTRTVYTVGLNFMIAVVMYFGLLRQWAGTDTLQHTLVTDRSRPASQ